jgi:hypothetical protein
MTIAAATVVVIVVRKSGNSLEVRKQNIRIYKDSVTKRNAKVMTIVKPI